jgi:hypothetical protein
MAGVLCVHERMFTHLQQCDKIFAPREQRLRFISSAVKFHHVGFDGKLNRLYARNVNAPLCREGESAR